MSEYISIKRATIHNLKNVTVKIPKNKLVVVTGISGSGKSSLLFDLIFEEGRRLYLEEIGAIANISNENNFDYITGISPTVAVKQNTLLQKNPRSTVGSKTKSLKILCSLYSEYSEQLHLNDIDNNNFSYNNPRAMCKNCIGLGKKNNVQINVITEKGNLSIFEILEKLGTSKGIIKYFKRQFGKDFLIPFKKINTQERNEFIYGHYLANNADHRSYCLERILNKKMKEGVNVDNFYKEKVCSACLGKRLNSSSLNVKICGYTISDLCMIPIVELKEVLKSISSCISEDEIQLINNLNSELNSLIDLDLGYLSLYRDISSLSGGELQKLYLSVLSRSNLSSIIYVLDEPLSGLFPSEKKIVFKLIDNLLKQGNSVLVVDHDKKMIEKADYIIDIGPGAGVNGGKIVYTGNYKGLLDTDKSLTGNYLSDPSIIYKRTIQEKINVNNNKIIELKNICKNNLKNINLKIPFGGYIIGIAGKSGSGKTSLINSLERNIREKSSNNIKLISVTQAPIGRSINSNLATFLKIWDEIRKIFAYQSLSIEKGLTKSHFSFNSKGACKNCNGTGRKVNEIGDGTKILTICTDCNGKRYKNNILKIKYKSLSIFDVLQLQVSEALKVFKDIPKIKEKLKIVSDIGLGYLTLGQSTSTLSGGEAQRLKLAKELESSNKIMHIYTLDEPTTGLSYYDISQLLKMLDKLTQKGDMIVACDHNMEFLRECDWLIELGPGSGNNGGLIIAQGTKYEICNSKYSELKKYL